MTTKILMGAVIGGMTGFGYFLYRLTCDDMSGTLQRPDANGDLQLVPQAIPKMMNAPLKQSFFWTPEFWSTNWFVTTGAGVVSGAIGASMLP